VPEIVTLDEPVGAADSVAATGIYRCQGRLARLVDVDLLLAPISAGA
jgi:hypothetical protein